MRASVLAVVAAASIVMSGCVANGGTQTVGDFGKFQQLQAGQTTKSQVYGLFGQPHGVTYGAAESVWRYYQVSSKINPTTYIPFVGLATGGNDMDITRAEFFFDADGKFVKTQREQQSKYVNQWAGISKALAPDDQVQAVASEMGRLGLPFDKKEAKEAASWAAMSK